MKKHLLTTSAIAGLVLLASNPAFAACDDNTPVTGTTVSCATGTDNTGINAPASTGLTINVNGGNIATTAAPGILIGAGNVTISSGSSVSASGADAIQYDGPGRVLVGGSVSSSGGNAFTYIGSNSADAVEFVNDGSVTGNVNFGQSTATYGVTSIATLTGTVTAGAGTTDTLRLEGAGSATFDTDEIGSKYIGFDSFLKGGGGTWTLSGSTARNWTLDGGSMAATATSLGNLNVISGGGFTMNGGGTYSGSITGAASLYVNDGNNLTFTGANSFTGETSIGAGILTVTDATSLSATSMVNISNGATLQFGSAFTFDRNAKLATFGSAIIDTNGHDVTMSGVIANGGSGFGNGSFTKTGTGILTLSGTNTYSGKTTINAGTLSVSASSNLGNDGLNNNIVFGGGTLATTATMTNARSLDLTGAGGLDVATGTILTQSGSLSGSSDLTKSGAGQLSLTGTNTNSGKVIISAGTVNISSDDNLGDNSVTNIVSLNGGRLSIGGGGADITHAIALDANSGLRVIGGNSTLSGVISGTHDWELTGSNRLTVSGTNTNSGKVTVTSGTLGVASTDNLGDASATNDIVLNGGTLQYLAAFDQARDISLTDESTLDTQTFDTTLSGVISGASKLYKDGSGTLTLTGANTYTGGLQIDAGVVAGNSASIKGNIQNSAGLNFIQSSTGTYAGVLTGGGTITKTGTGNLIFTGNSGAWAGTTDVNAGTLSVNGTLDGTINVGASGKLGGSGTVDNIAITGTLAPGNSIGTLTSTGNVSFASGAHYAVEYSNSAADRLNATGSITINNAAILDLTGTGVSGDYTTNKVYTILHAGTSLSGTFGTINNNLAFLDATMAYTATDATVTLARNDATVQSVVTAPSLVSTATAVNDLGNSNPIVQQINGMTAAQATAAVQSLSGTQIASTANTIMVSAANMGAGTAMRMQSLSNSFGTPAPTLQIQNGGMQLPDNTSIYTGAYLEPAAGHAVGKYELWGNVIGSIGSADAKGTALGQDSHSYGFVAGMDRPFLNDGFFGVYGGYTRGFVASDSDTGDTDINSYQGGVYASQMVGGGINLSAGAGAGWSDIASVRNVTVGGLNFRPEGDTSAITLNAFAEVSKSLTVQDVAIQPYAKLGVVRSHTKGFTEKNGGSANLTVDDTTTTSPTSTIGARTGATVGPVNLSADLGWQHTYGDVDSTSSMKFANGTTSFTSSGLPIARNAAVIGVQGQSQVSESVNAYAGYNGTIATDARDHAVTAGVKVKF